MNVTPLGLVDGLAIGRTGHVEFLISEDRQARNIVVYLTCPNPELFAIVPGPDLPYHIPKLGNFPRSHTTVPKEKTLTFAVTPLKAEPGKSYECQLHFSWSHGSSSQPKEENGSLTVTLPVYANDSTYFAIGVAKTIQEKSEQFYVDMVAKGRESQQQRWALFSSDLDPGRVVVNEQSFNWAMSIMELGSRIYRSQVEAVKRNIDRDRAADTDTDTEPGSASHDSAAGGGGSP